MKSEVLKIIIRGKRKISVFFLIHLQVYTFDEERGKIKSETEFLFKNKKEN